MGKRADRVMQESNKVRNLFYGSVYPCKIKDCEYQNYISDNKDNDAVLDSVLFEKGIKLVIAPAGSGKSTAILSRAEELVANNKDYRVIFGLPTRALTSQTGNSRAAKVATMMGGDSFDENSPLTATTYEKMYEVDDYIERQNTLGKSEKVVLVLDESHLLTTQHTFRQDAISKIISGIEHNQFYSIVLVTATPEPMSLFHCDGMFDFYSSNRIPSVDRLEIIEVDDPVEYIKGIDYSKEFPFIRLNNKSEIDNLIAQMPQRKLARLTSDDREKKVYLDIVEHEKIDASQIDGILATSVIEAGVSITDYPDNIVPIAVFTDNNISANDIEQFLNRIRAKGNKHVKCARVIVRKSKQQEIKVNLCSCGNDRSSICEFQDIHMEMGNLTINDTGLMDAVGDGKYRLHFEIGTNSSFDRYITVASNGATGEKLYSKKNPAPITFKGIGFEQFFDILKRNFREKDRLSEPVEALKLFWEEKRNAQNLSGDEMAREKWKNEEFIRQLVSGYIKQAGEIGECFSFENGEVCVDKRVCYEISYRQFNRQYYHNHDLLMKELEFRLDTDVVLLEQDTQKGKKAPRNMDDIWDGIEDLRQEIEQVGDDIFWSNLMGKNSFSFGYTKRETVSKVAEQEHLMEILKRMEKQEITGRTALRILFSSRDQKKVNEYVKCFYSIAFNEQLEEHDGRDINQILGIAYKGRKKELILQSVIYSYLEQKGVQSPNITKTLEEEIQKYYVLVIPNTAKPPTVRSIGNKMRMMYKSRGKNRIDKQLRTNRDDIFNLVKSDYQ